MQVQDIPLDYIWPEENHRPDCYPEMWVSKEGEDPGENESSAFR